MKKSQHLFRLSPAKVLPLVFVLTSGCITPPKARTEALSPEAERVKFLEKAHIDKLSGCKSGEVFEVNTSEYKDMEADLVRRMKNIAGKKRHNVVVSHMEVDMVEYPVWQIPRRCYVTKAKSFLCPPKVWQALVDADVF